jgi:hypothetical protein
VVEADDFGEQIWVTLDDRPEHTNWPDIAGVHQVSGCLCVTHHFGACTSEEEVDVLVGCRDGWRRHGVWICVVLSDLNVWVGINRSNTRTWLAGSGARACKKIRLTNIKKGCIRVWSEDRLEILRHMTTQTTEVTLTFQERATCAPRYLTVMEMVCQVNREIRELKAAHEPIYEEDEDILW